METAHWRFNRWAQKGLWEKFFLSYEAKLIQNGYSQTEAISAVTSDASGARYGEVCAIGQLRGGTTTKIHLVVDSYGNPIDFDITEGDIHDSQVAEQLIRMA